MPIRNLSSVPPGPFKPASSPRARQILFVGQCNDALSQMAEAFAAALLTPLGVLVASAGLTPTGVRPCHL
jgi:hypothetical protein